MSSSNIEKSLETAATTFVTVGSPSLPSSVIQKENVRDKKPSSGTGWARFTYIPNPPVAVTLAEEGYDEITGIFQIDLAVPSNKGKTLLQQFEDKARDSFPCGKAFTSSGVTTRITSAGMGGGRPEGSSYVRTLTLSFLAHVKRSTLT